MNHFDPAAAAKCLPHVNPGCVRGGLAVGLRDGAVLALVVAELSSREIAGLRAHQVRQVGRRVFVKLDHRLLPLPDPLGSRLLAWLVEQNIWGSEEPVFAGQRGALTPEGVIKIVRRYLRGVQ